MQADVQGRQLHPLARRALTLDQGPGTAGDLAIEGS